MMIFSLKKTARYLSATGFAACAGMVLASCGGTPTPADTPEFAQGEFPDWRASDASYRFFPGDALRLDVRTAPELNGLYKVAPDGRATFPLIGNVMVSNTSRTELEVKLEDRYSAELRDPSLQITPEEFGSQKIFVGGEVQAPGLYDLPGAIDPLQAILLAGGWTDEGKPAAVIVMRRGPGGQLMTRTLNVRKGISQGTLNAVGPLQRFDVVYVSRKAIADENLFVRQFIRDALPINFGLYYDINRF